MFKTAKVTILSYRNNSGKTQFSKVASYYSDSTIEPVFTEDSSIKSPMVDSIKEKLSIVSDIYHISKNPQDYVYIAVRALTADIPNENWDAFSEKELLRFELTHGCRVYQTFNLKPHHINHRSQDPTQARGVILDSHYNTKNDQHFPEILVAVDKTKDKRLTEGITSGEITGFSMGCDAAFTICNVCGTRASSPSEFCNHIKFGKGKEFDGKIAFEWCEGVTFVEESSVDDPADKNAITQEVILASKETKNDFTTETEFLAINSKLNTLISTVESIKGGGSVMAKEANVAKKAETMTAEDANIDKSIEVTTDEKKEEEEKEEDKIKTYKKKEETEAQEEMTPEEFGVKTDEVSPTPGTQASKENPYKNVREANPYLQAGRKESVDSDAKKVYKKYIKDYGDDATKDIKPKKIGYIVTCYSSNGEPNDRIKVASYREALTIGREWEVKGGKYTIVSDKGQMFTKLDNQKGNPPKEFKIDSEKGNPPKEFKFADKGQMFTKLDNQKGNPPKEFKIDSEKGNPPKEFKFADKGQMFTKLDNQKGNPPKEFKIDSEKGNPPKEFKFAKVYSGVEIFSPSLTSKYWIVAKSKIPSFLLFRPFVKGARKEDSKKAMLSILKDIAKDGLYVTMKKENAHKLKSLYETKYEPSMVEEFKGDIKDPKKFRPRPGAGVEQEGKDDLEAVDRSKVKEPSVDADGAKDMPLKHSSTRKQAQDLEELFKIIDAEEAKGTSDDQIIKMIDVWIEGKGKGSSKVVLDKKVEKNLVAGKRLRTNPYSASVTDRAVRDMKGIEKLQPEAATGSVAKGEDDIAKIKRDEVRADEVYSGGKDDLDIKRDQVVDLKASVEKKRKYLFAKELELKKAKIELHQQKEAEFEEYKKSFRDRFIRALRLAVKRANLNIIDNELKLVFGDVLTTPTEDYVGMDSDLAMYLIEGAFSKGEDTYIKSLLKEAEKYVDLPEESFLILEEDAQKVNPIIPLVASLKEVEEQENALVEKAEGNNPVFMPKDGSAFSGKWEHLKGVFNERLI